MDSKTFSKEFKKWAKKYKFEIVSDVELENDSEPREEIACRALFDEHEPVPGLFAFGQFNDMEFGEPPESYLPVFINGAISLLPDCKWQLASVESDDQWETAVVTFKHRTKGLDQYAIDDLENSDWLSTGTIDCLEAFSIKNSKYRIRSFVLDNFFTIAALKHTAAEALETLIYPKPESSGKTVTYGQELESLVFPYEIHRVKASKALSKLKELKKENRGQPVIIGDDYNFRNMQLNLSRFDLGRSLDQYSAALEGKKEAQGAMQKDIKAIVKTQQPLNQKREIEIASLEFDGAPIKELLAVANDIDVQSWIEKRKSETPKPKTRRKAKAENSEDTAAVFDDDGLLSVKSEGLLTSCVDHWGEAHDRVYIANLPIEEAWQVPCFLNMRAFDPHPEFPYQYETNEAPDYAVLSAVFKYWHAQYDLQIVGANSNSVEILIKNLPSSKKKAEQLAYEHYYLCPSILNSEIESIGQLTDVLIRERFWYLVGTGHWGVVPFLIMKVRYFMSMMRVNGMTE